MQHKQNKQKYNLIFLSHLNFLYKQTHFFNHLCFHLTWYLFACTFQFQEGRDEVKELPPLLLSKPRA